tara:strand:+ start:123 stop:716 length:594 start_codon:yes stop_codon:yes gene_type:complete
MEYSFHVDQPEWLPVEEKSCSEIYATTEERMALVIRFSELNVRFETGGPFAAAVFESETGRLVSVGVNQVISSKLSFAHAEVCALSLAQRRLGNFDLGARDTPAHQLVVNWAPCVMCYGAAIWSGITSLVTNSGPEMEEITGFDEGPLHPEWREQLHARGIIVREGVMREKALAVFRRYRDSGAPVYNARERSRENL